MTVLSEQMKAAAVEQEPAVAARLVDAAEAFDTAAHAAYGPGGTNADLKRMLGAWARARRVYCGVTGEPLV